MHRRGVTRPTAVVALASNSMEPRMSRLSGSLVAPVQAAVLFSPRYPFHGAVIQRVRYLPQGPGNSHRAASENGRVM